MKRISADIYEETRSVLRDFLSSVSTWPSALAPTLTFKQVIRDCSIYVEYRNAKTVTINDVCVDLGNIDVATLLIW